MSNKTYSSRLIKRFISIFAVILISSLLTSCEELEEASETAYHLGIVVGIIGGVMLSYEFYTVGKIGKK